jgi:hypothetical protein
MMVHTLVGHANVHTTPQDDRRGARQEESSWYVACALLAVK